MKEIKQTKCKRCFEWFLSHIVVIAVIAFAIGLFLSSCHFAKADSASDLNLYIDYISEDCNLSSSEKENFISELSSYDYKYIVRFETLDTYSSGLPVVVYGFCPQYFNLSPVEVFGSPSRYSIHWNSGYQAVVPRDNGFSNARFVFVGCTNNSTSFCYSYTTTTKGGTNSSQGFDYWNTNYHSVFNNGIGAGINYCSQTNIYYWSMDDSMPKFGFRYSGYADYNLSSGSSSWSLLYDLINPYITDSRLKFATWTDAIGRSILHVDMTDYLNSTGFNISNTTLNEFTLSLEYAIQNSDDIESHTISYNNSSELFHEYGENGKITSIYMNIPYTEFYGYSYESNSFPNYDDVIIQNAIINLDLVPVGGSNSINITSYVDCIYYLQHVYSDIAPDVVPDPIYEDTIIYDATIINDMKTSLHNKTSQYSFVSGDWVFIDENDLPTFENWASVFTNYVWFADVNSDTTYSGHWWQMANNIPSVADLSRPFDPSEWIELNKAFAFYDIIVLKVWRCGVHVVGPSPPVVSVDELAGYLVLYSDRYYQHYEVENQLGIIEILQNDATNAVSFYDAIKTRVDDFEEKTLDAITGDDNSLFAYINNLDNDINSGISRIIDSMPVFNWTPFNDDDILMALYTIVNNQENPKDGYARYISWVKSESSAENGFKVWANDMFDVFHDVYNFFNYQDDIDPNKTGLQKYVDYVKLYIQYLTQQTDGISSNEYVYYKGIFDNTYDLHDVNG